MIGVVGKLKISYKVSEKEFEEIIEITQTKQFQLSNVPEVHFSVDEIQYIEDTVYGVDLTLISPKAPENEYFIYGRDCINFSIPSCNLIGTMCLKFF